MIMSALRLKRYGILPCCLLALTLTGCFGTSQPSRFYTLSSLSGKEPVANDQAGNRIVVAIGPLSIPDYLNGPEIITRAGQNEIRVNEFERWAGSLQDNMTRSMIEDLSVLMPEDRFSIIRWDAASERERPIAYRVAVDVSRFDAGPGGSVFLEADWTVYGEDRNLVAARKSGIAEKAAGNNFADLVAAMSRAVEDLSRQIAKTIDTLDLNAGGRQDR
jgi:uncharacterized lipoprotein YmbA